MIIQIMLFCKDRIYFSSYQNDETKLQKKLKTTWLYVFVLI
jgi:hypothetical protein